MLMSHNTHNTLDRHTTTSASNTNRHLNHWGLAALIARTLNVGACLLLSAIMGLLWTKNASAQEFPPNGPGSWGIEITSSFPLVSTVAVGDITNNMSLDLSDLVRFEEIPEEATFSLWQVEPSDAARIITPMPNYPAHAPVEIEFLRATTVTVRVRGYDDADVLPIDPIFGYDFNELEFTFNVLTSADSVTEEATQTDNPNTLTPLNANERQAQTATNLFCDATRANAGTPLDAQGRLLATCDSLALFDDPAPALDRISAEELFAMGDALTITADNQISNIQSRINTLRARTREQIDLNSLNIKLWNQSLPGRVLSASKDALSEYNAGHHRPHNTANYEQVDGSDTVDAELNGAGTRGSGASQDAIIDSALGIFVNGNLSIGTVDGQGIQQDADIHTSALTFGADYRLDDQKVIGAALGIVNDNTEFHADNGDMDMQGISLSAFGSWYEQDEGYADIIIDIGHHAFDLSRRMNLPGQATEFAEGSADASRIAMSVNAGRTFQRGATEFGPVVRLAMTRSSIDRFRETSSLAGTGNALELDVRSHSVTSLRFSVGAEVRHVINTSRAILVPAVRMDLEVENDTDKGIIAATFVNDPDSNTMNFIGTERDRTAVLLSVGTSATFKYGQSAFAFVETRAQDDHVSQSRVRLGYRMHF